MPDQEHQVLSRGAYERLKSELEELQTEGRSAVAERLQRARELGDISENAEFHATKDEQAHLETRIRRLEHLLRTVEVVDAPIKADHAVPGTVVTLRPVDGGDEERYLLASSIEERARSMRTVTPQSPLGKVVFGARPGDTVTVRAPGGTFAYEVVGIKSWDGQD